MVSTRAGKLVLLEAPDQIKIRRMTSLIRARYVADRGRPRERLQVGIIHLVGRTPAHQGPRVGHKALYRIVERGEGANIDYAGEPNEEGDFVVPRISSPADTAGTARLASSASVCTPTGTSRSRPRRTHFHGAFSTHSSIHPEQFFYTVLEEINDVIAANANCTLPQVLCGLDQVDGMWSDTVAILGASGLGLNAVTVAAERGADTIVFDGVDERVDRAEQFGADHTIQWPSTTPLSGVPSASVSSPMDWMRTSLLPDYDNDN